MNLVDILNRATLNGALIGSGTAEGSKRILATARRLLRQSAKSKRLSKYISDSMQQATKDPQTAAFMRLAASPFRDKVMENVLGDYSDRKAGATINELYRALLEGKMPEDGGRSFSLLGESLGRMYDKLPNAPRFFTKGKLTKEVRDNISRKYDSVLQTASHGAPLMSDIDNKTGAPAMATEGALGTSLTAGKDNLTGGLGLVQIGKKGDKVKGVGPLGELLAKREPVLSDDVFVTGRRTAHGLYIEDPVYNARQSRSGSAVQIANFIANSKTPVGSVMTADIAQMLQRTNPNVRVAGLTTGIWYDKAGRKVEYPKALVVNKAGLKHWREFADIHTGIFGDPVYFNKDMEVPQSFLDAIKEHAAVTEKKMRWLDNEKLKLDTIPGYRDWKRYIYPNVKSIRKAMNETLPDSETFSELRRRPTNFSKAVRYSLADLLSGMSAADANAIAKRNPELTAEQIEQMFKDFNTQGALRPSAYKYENVPDFIAPYAMRKTSGLSVDPILAAYRKMTPYKTTFKNAWTNFKKNPGKATKEIMARTFVEAPGNMFMSLFQGAPKHLFNNRALAQGLVNANPKASPDALANTLRRYRTNQASLTGLALLLTGLGTAGTFVKTPTNKKENTL